MVLIMLRRIGQHESPVTSAIWYNGVGAVIFVGYQLMFDLPLPQASGDKLILVGLGWLPACSRLPLPPAIVSPRQARLPRCAILVFRLAWGQV